MSNAYARMSAAGTFDEDESLTQQEYDVVTEVQVRLTAENAFQALLRKHYADLEG